MSSPTCRFKVLGLSLLTLCMAMALAAGSAQGNWLENGVELNVNRNVITSAHTPIGLAVPALNIEFRCTVLESEELKLLASSEKGEKSVLFLNCDAYSPANLKGTLQKNCQPKEPILAQGYGLIILHNGKNYILIGQVAGQPLLLIDPGPLCALAEHSNVTGSVVLECGQLNGSGIFVGEDCNVARLDHLYQAAPAALFEADKLKFGANAATLDGIALAKLDSDLPWAAHV